MRVLVVSDGKHELDLESRTSPLVELTRRLMNRDAEFEREKVSDKKVHVHFQPGKSTDYEKRALGWIRYAEREGFDALVLVIDQDGVKERETGIANAQGNERLLLPRAMGIAIRSFDAWMLADEQALSRVHGCKVFRQGDPESIKKPKEVCEGLRDESPHNFGLTEVYLQLAEAIDLDCLAERCPRGFAPFGKRVEALTKF